jgi:hypothetical protein
VEESEVADTAGKLGVEAGVTFLRTGRFRAVDDELRHGLRHGRAPSWYASFDALPGPGQRHE